MPQSELLTHDGYPAVKLENGSYMTEYSITVTDSRLNNGRPTNIPSLWERKIVDQDTAVNKAIQSKKEYKSFDTIKDAVSDSERKSNAGGANAPKEYNRGGTVRNLLATGGMMQEGGTTDPVSGNDVPTGSLKEEVRDDIDAKLSPGEFVFPADVTRYIGLDKLMQIREAAKEGLKEMESKGQMGNAEEVDGDAVDEDKFSTNIDEIIADLDGGDDNSEPKEFAEGGIVKADPSYKDAPIKGFRMVQYEDPETKAVKYIPFINGKPLLPIPKGYVEKKAAAPVTPPPTTTPVVEQPLPSIGGGGGGDRGGKSETDGDGGGVNVDVGDTGIEGFGDIQSGTSRNIARAIGGGVGFINPFVGMLVSAAGQYVIKVNNEKVAEANAAAIDASALAAAGFNEAEIARAKEAAAKATMEGKSAKEVAVAAANAASLSAGTALGKSVDGYYGAKTSLDALIGITNGFNTANKDVMEMPKELADKVGPGMWGQVVEGLKLGLSPEQAVERVGPITEAMKSLKDQETSLAAEQLGVPAGEYNNVIADMSEGYTAKEAIKRAEERVGYFNPDGSFVTGTDDGAEARDTQMRQEAKANAEKVQAERNAEVARQEAERADTQMRQEAAERAERTQAERNAEVARQEAERADAQTRQEAAERAERTQAERNAEVARQEAERAADRESQGGGGGGGGADPNDGRSDSDRDRGD